MASNGNTWLTTLPPIVAQAVITLAKDEPPVSDAALIAWIDRGLSIKVRCGFPNGHPMSTGVWHQIRVVGNKVLTPDHRSQPDPAYDDDNLRNMCHAGTIALRGSGPVTEMDVYHHWDERGNSRHMTHGEVSKLEATRTVWIAAEFLRTGWTLDAIEPLLEHGPGPAEAIPLLAGGISVERVAAWAGHDLESCARWSGLPDVEVGLAEAFDQAGLAPAEVARWSRLGVDPSRLLDWLALRTIGTVVERDVPAWEGLGVSPPLYRALRRLDPAGTVTPARFQEWTDIGIPAAHVGVYEYAGFSPSDIGIHGVLFAEHDPWEVIRALGRLTDSTSMIPASILATYLGEGDVPFTATFLEGYDHPLTKSARRRAVDPPEACFERKQSPAIDWSCARKAIAKGRSKRDLFTVPSLLSALDVDLMGTYDNTDRIEMLRTDGPAGRHHERAWHVGVLYPARSEIVDDYDELIGVVTRAGHVGCLTRYHYLRPFVEALTESGYSFVVPVWDDGETNLSVPLPRHGDLKAMIEELQPLGLAWQWPPWPE